MEERGLVRRLPDPDDRRGVLIELTVEGRSLWEQTFAAQADKEAVIASALSPSEQAAPNDLLRRLIHAFEERHGPPGKRKAE
jgi:DNA-binding MarR family transcriptional regulator